MLSPHAARNSSTLSTLDILGILAPHRDPATKVPKVFKMSKVLQFPAGLLMRTLAESRIQRSGGWSADIDGGRRRITCTSTVGHDT
jgi:hypothetical protein